MAKKWLKKGSPLIYIKFLQKKFIYILGHIFCSIKRNLLFLEAQQNLDQADLFTVVVYMNYVVKKFKKFNLKLGQILKKSKNAHIF